MDTQKNDKCGILWAVFQRGRLEGVCWRVVSGPKFGEILAYKTTLRNLYVSPKSSQLRYGVAARISPTLSLGGNMPLFGKEIPSDTDNPKLESFEKELFKGLISSMLHDLEKADIYMDILLDVADSEELLQPSKIYNVDISEVLRHSFACVEGTELKDSNSSASQNALTIVDSAIEALGMAFERMEHSLTATARNLFDDPEWKLPTTLQVFPALISMYLTATLPMFAYFVHQLSEPAQEYQRNIRNMDEGLEDLLNDNG